MNLWAFRCLLWYICVLMVQPQNRFPVLWPLHIANVSFIAAAVLHILACLKDERPILKFGTATKLGLVLLGFAFLANYGSPYQDVHVWNPWIDTLAKNVLVMMFIEAMCTTVRRVWVVQMTNLVCTLWWLKAGLRLASAGATYSGDRMMGAAVGLIENPNSFAYNMCVFLPFYLYAFEHTRNMFLRWAFLAGAVAGVYVVLKTGSRTGLVTLIAMGVFMVRHYRKLRLRNVALVVLAIFLIVPLSGEGNIQRFKTIPQSMASFFGHGKVREGPLTQDEQSAEERQAKNRDTWKLIKAYPLFGVGFSPSWTIISQFGMARGQVHCEIMRAGVQMGFIGMGLYAGILLLGFLKGLRIQRDWKDCPEVADMGWLFCMQSLLIAVGGSFCPMPWLSPMMVMAGSASALAGIKQAQEN